MPSTVCLIAEIAPCFSSKVLFSIKSMVVRWAGAKSKLLCESTLLSRYLAEGWEELYGGKLEFLNDADEIIKRTLDHIDKKRAALGLPEYDPEKFGRSGDARMAEIEALPADAVREAADALRGAWAGDSSA